MSDLCSVSILLAANKHLQELKLMVFPLKKNLWSVLDDFKMSLWFFILFLNWNLFFNIQLEDEQVSGESPFRSSPLGHWLPGPNSEPTPVTWVR